MQISPERIHQFQQLYRHHFGVTLSEEEAYERGMQLLKIMKQVYKPILSNEFSNSAKAEGIKEVMQDD